MTVSIEEHYGGAVRSPAIAESVSLVLGTGRIKHLNIARFGVIVYLPNATRLPLQTGGPVFILKNESACYPFCLYNFDGDEIGYVHKNSWARIFCLGTSTSGGNWGLTTCPIGGTVFTPQRSVGTNGDGGCATSTTNDAAACGGTETTEPPVTTTTDEPTTSTISTSDWGGTVTGTGTDVETTPDFEGLIQSCPGGAGVFSVINNIFGTATIKSGNSLSTGSVTTDCHVFDSSLQFNPVAMPSQLGRVAQVAGRSDIVSLASADLRSSNQQDRSRGLRADGTSAFGTQSVPFALRGISLHHQNENINGRRKRPAITSIIPV